MTFRVHDAGLPDRRSGGCIGFGLDRLASGGAAARMVTPWAFHLGLTDNVLVVWASCCTGLITEKGFLFRG